MKFLDLVSQYRRIKKDVDSAIRRVVESGAFVQGEDVREFEREIALYCNVPYALGLNSGTDALYLSLKALGIKEGDEVITTPFTFIATASAIAQTGAIPVFVDIDPVTYAIDPAKIARRVTKRTKAILPVHLFGRMASMREIMKIARVHKLFVIEDAAQAIGAEENGRKVGSFGDAGCFSFFPSKNLGAYGDGGMVVTKNKKLAEQIRLLKNHGSSAKEKYLHLVIGTNSRLDSLQAAVLRIKLKHLASWSKARREKAAYYNVKLAGIVQVRTPEIPDREEHIFHQYTIRVPRRDALRSFLLKEGIPTMVYYPIPLHLQPALSYLKHKRGDFPEAERASKEVISLPLYPEISRKDQDLVAGSIRKFFA